MKKILLYLLATTVFVLPMPIVAKEGASANSDLSKPVQNRENYDAEGQGYQVRNQNQVETKNQGEASQLKVNTQEQESLSTNKDGEGSMAAKLGEGRSDNAREHMSVVARKVEELLAIEDNEEGIGQEIRIIAQAQKLAQQKMKDGLDKLESRSGFAKLIMGSDMKALNSLKKEMEQNQLRIKKLEKLQNQLQNQGAESQLKEAIQAMVEQNTALQDKIQTEEQQTGLLGWLLNLFNL